MNITRKAAAGRQPAERDLISMEKLAGRLTQLRQQRGLSIDELAFNAGIAYTTLYRRFRNPGSFTFEELEKTCAALGVSPLTLITDSAVAA